VWSRKRRNEEECGQRGFTLIEAVVALGVLTVVLVPTTSVFWGGMQAASVSSVRSDAASVAASTLAQVQALPINEVGFYTGQPNFVSTCPSSVSACGASTDDQTVVLGSTAPVGAFAPVTTQQVGATTFTITTYITWADASVPSGTCISGSSTCQGAYPLVTVVVTWGGPTAGSVTESTIDYPGGLGKWTAAGYNRTGLVTCPSTPETPDQNTPQLGNGTSTSPTYAWVDVSWQPPNSMSDDPCYYVIDVATDSLALPIENLTNHTCKAGSGSGVQASRPQPGTADSYLVTGLSWSTTYYFEVVAYSSGGAQCAVSNIESFATTTTTGSTCTVTSFSVTAEPSNSSSKTYLDSHGNMTDDLDLVAGTTGTCSNFTVNSELVGSTTQDPGSPWALTAGSGGQFSYTVASMGTAWTTGQHEFTLSINGTATNEQQSLEVCSFASGNGQKSTSGNSCP
jgi:Tfp pilus assembly protein PilV